MFNGFIYFVDPVVCVQCVCVLFLTIIMIINCEIFIQMARRIAMLEADLERAEERASKNERFVDN